MADFERFGFTSNQRHRNPGWRRLHWRARDKAEGEQDHENAFATIALQSSWHQRPVARRPNAGTAIARVLAFLKRMKTAIEAELAARQAIAELASMSDYMLRDLGISRSEIENAVRRRGDPASR